MLFKLLMIVWLSTGPEFTASGWLAEHNDCRSFAQAVIRAYPRGAVKGIDVKCIEGYPT